MTALATQLERDARMTAERSEAKYLVSAEHAQILVAEIANHVARHHHVGEGANALPDPQHHVTTIYFDTPSRALYRAAKSQTAHLKLRAKEYYDVHLGLLETATDPYQLVRYQPTLWLELKSRDGVHSGKQRIALPKRDVPAFFARVREPMAGDPARESVAALCASLGEPLAADCLVNYKRMAWQDPAGELRITLDRDLAFYRPPDDLWTRERALVRTALAPAVAKEARRILEIKLRAEPPSWLVSVLEQLGLEPSPYSKFEAASSAIHGRR
jgi:hypothetical protein